MRALSQCLLSVAVLAIGAERGAIAEGDKPPASRLTVGEAVPEFTAQDEQGDSWKSSDHVGKKILVLYVYPGDFTGGCIRQAQMFRENLAKLEVLDVEVVGISGDSVETHRLFKESHGLKHTLLSDSQGYLACELGIPAERCAKVRARNLDGQPILDEKGKSLILERNVTLPRWTLIIDRDGKLISKRTQVNPATDAEEVRKLIADLAK